MHSAGAIHPWLSISFQGASYRFGPMSEKTSPSRPSSRTSVAVSPSRRRACSSAVIRKIGRGQQVDLVVDDQPPVAGVEQLQVRGRPPFRLVVITW